MPIASDERRNFHRIATDKPVTMRAGDVRLTGKLLDISLRGLLLELDPDCPSPAIGTLVQAGVLLDQQTPDISMDGEVAHVTENRIGLHCIGMDLESASILRRMVELNLGDEELLERDLAQMISA